MYRMNWDFATIFLLCLLRAAASRVPAPLKMRAPARLNARPCSCLVLAKTLQRCQLRGMLMRCDKSERVSACVAVAEKQRMKVLERS